MTPILIAESRHSQNLGAVLKSCFRALDSSLRLHLISIVELKDSTTLDLRIAQFLHNFAGFLCREDSVRWRFNLAISNKFN